METNIGLMWEPISQLESLKDGEVVLISHNRETWQHEDEARNNCVVVTWRVSDDCPEDYDEPEDYEGPGIFEEFGPDSFLVDEVDYFARFNPPKLEK